MRYLVIVVLLLGGCSVCEPLMQRCLNNSAQLCNSAGRWNTVMDCSTVKPKEKQWTCTKVKKVHTCLPKEKIDASR